MPFFGAFGGGFAPGDTGGDEDGAGADVGAAVELDVVIVAVLAGGDALDVDRGGHLRAEFKLAFRICRAALRRISCARNVTVTGVIPVIIGGAF